MDQLHLAHFQLFLQPVSSKQTQSIPKQETQPNSPKLIHTTATPNTQRSTQQAIAIPDDPYTRLLHATRTKPRRISPANPEKAATLTHHIGRSSKRRNGTFLVGTSPAARVQVRCLEKVIPLSCSVQMLPFMEVKLLNDNLGLVLLILCSYLLIESSFIVFEERKAAVQIWEVESHTLKIEMDCIQVVYSRIHESVLIYIPCTLSMLWGIHWFSKANIGQRPNVQQQFLRDEFRLKPKSFSATRLRRKPIITLVICLFLFVYFICLTLNSFNFGSQIPSRTIFCYENLFYLNNFI
ncbi:hypothetical protein H5410_009701 [Solanum commersonii]|uniref:Uncharacterized protein n=1 Tax=Solanum commersonii TaxID=4109 RepID=A0A9J6AJI4_SOLCO|nr:hypothetical protein H5410_009701 [Solanum commersonii]